MLTSRVLGVLQSTHYPGERMDEATFDAFKDKDGLISKDQLRVANHFLRMEWLRKQVEMPSLVLKVAAWPARGAHQLSGHASRGPLSPVTASSRVLFARF